MKSRKFKWASPLFIIFLAIAGVFSVGGVMAAKQAEETPVVQKADANTGKSLRLYLDTSSYWSNDNVKWFVARASGTNCETTNFGFTNVSGNLYCINIDSGYTTFIFYRVNETQYYDLIANNYEPSGSGEGKGYYKNKIGSTSRSTNNRLNVTGWASGSWTTYKILNSGETIHLKTGGQTSGWATASANIYAWCWMTNYSQWATATWNNTEGYYTFTLPGDCTGFTLVRQDPSQPARSGTTWGSETVWNQSDVILDSKKTLLDVTTAGSIGSWSFFCDTYIYYVNDDNNATGNYVYSWGSSTYFGSWPGTQITSIGGVSTVEGDVKFNGSTAKKIYKIPYSTYAGDTGVKFRGGDDDWQTADFSLVSGAAYIWTKSSTDAYSDRGSAIDLILQEESLRKAATSQSICNITKGNCSTLYSTYSSTLSATARNFVDTSYTLTYPSSSTSATKVDVSLQKVFHQIGINGGNISSSIRGFSPLTLFGDSEDGFSILIIIVASSVALLSVTALSILVLKKRKRKEQ